jgi:hypothetical protein
VVESASGEGAQLLVWELPLGLALDQKQSSGTQLGGAGLIKLVNVNAACIN